MVMNGNNPFLGFNGLDPITKIPLGREKELKQLNRITQHLGSLHLLLKGPRGVGKTTLLTALIKAAEWDSEKEEERPIIFKVSLTALDTVAQVVQRIRIAQDTSLDTLAQSSKPSAKTIFVGMKKIFNKDFIRERARDVSDCATKGEATSEALITTFLTGRSHNSEGDAFLEVDQYVEAFCSYTRALIGEARKKISDNNEGKEKGHPEYLPNLKGAIFIFDEADTVDPKRFPIATFIKLAHEQFSIDNNYLVSFIVAGLDNVDKRLLESHPSALRLLELVELEPFQGSNDSQSDSAATIFVKQFLDVHAHKTVSTWGKEECKLLTRLGEGIPFWVQRISYYAYAAATDDATQISSMATISVSHILDGYERALREVGRAACQGAMSTTNSADARRIIACLAFSGQRELEKSELIRIAGLVEDRAADPALREVIDTEAVRSRRTSAGTMIHFVTDGYQRWLCDELGALDIVDSMPSLTQALHDLKRPIVFSGEAVPAFDGVKSLFDGVMERLGLPAHSKKVVFEEYTHEHLFATLGVSPKVESLGGGSELRFEWKEAEHKRSMAELWEMSDVLAIPAYLLSEAYRMGVYDLDELTSDLPESPSWKRYLEASTVGFFGTCVFNNTWIALPFTLIPKVYYTYGLKPEDEIDGILLEGKKGSLSLAYLWSEYARRRENPHTKNPGAMFRFDEERMDINFTEWDKPEKKQLKASLDAFKDIVLASDNHRKKLKDVRKGITWSFPSLWCHKEDQTPAPILSKMVENKLSYYGWADWFVQINEGDRKQFSVSAFPPKLSASGMASSIIHPKDTSITREDNLVWADSWVLVFPKNRITKSLPSRADTLAKFRVFMALMAPDWQSEFHIKTGVSPFRSVLKSIRAWQKFPWLKELDLDQIRLMSMGEMFDHYRMQAKTALLSQYIYPNKTQGTDLPEGETAPEEQLKKWELRLGTAKR